MRSDNDKKINLKQKAKSKKQKAKSKKRKAKSEKRKAKSEKRKAKSEKRINVCFMLSETKNNYKIMPQLNKYERKQLCI